MTRFKPRISCGGSNHSTNCAKNQRQRIESFFTFLNRCTSFLTFTYLETRLQSELNSSDTTYLKYLFQLKLTM